MSIIRVEEIIKEVNEQIAGSRLAELLNYHAEKVQVTGNTIKCFCPLHQEQAFRSLLLEDKTKAYRCTMKRCVGFNGGTYVDLWAEANGLESLEAALDLAEKLELDVDVAMLRNLGGQMAEQASRAMAQGNLTEARQAADQAVAFLPGDIPAGMTSAEIYLAQGEDDRGLEEFLRVIDICVESSIFEIAHEILVKLSSDHPGRTDLAVREATLAKAETNHVGHCDALLRLAHLYGEKGDLDEQMSTVEELLRVGGEDTDILERVATIYKKAKRIPELIETLERLSTFYEAEKDWDDLRSVLERRGALEPDNLEIAETMALVLERLGETEQAAERLLALSRTYAGAGDTPKAQALLNRLLKAQPDNTEAMERLAKMYDEGGNPSQAIDTYRKLATSARESGEVERSAHYLAQAREIDPDDLGLRGDLAEALLSQNRVDEGITELFALANLHLNEADPKEGFAILGRIADLAPEDVQGQIKIGRCLEAAGHDEKALEGYLEFIQRMQTAGNHAEALEVCEEARRLTPNDEPLLERQVQSCLELGRKTDAIEAYQKMAKVYMTDADFEGAERLLQQGIRIDRTEPKIKTELAHLYELIGRVHDAVGLWIEVALFHRASEDPDRSTQAIREALRLDPESTEAMGMLAEAQEAEGKTEEALELWTKMAKGLLEKDAQSAEGLKVLEHALDLAPSSLELLSEVARVKFDIHGPQEAHPVFSQWLEAAEREGNESATLQAYEEAVTRYPQSSDWRFKLAHSFIKQGKETDALPHLEQLIELYQAEDEKGEKYRQTLEKLSALCPDRLDVRLRWAEVLATEGEMDRAAEIFSGIAQNYLERGDQDKGLEVLQISLLFQPENGELLRRIAELLESAGRQDEAVDSYEKLVELNRHAGNVDENIVTLERLILLRPDRADLRLELAELHESRGDVESAVEHYFRVAQSRAQESPAGDETLELCRKLVLLAPEFLAARETLVECYLAREEIENAKDELDKLSELALQQGDLDQAEKIFKRIQEIDPHDIRSNERLGKLFEAKGRTEEAVEAYRTVLALYDEQDDEERVIGILVKLKDLAEDDLDLRVDLARRLGGIGEREDEARAEWLALISAAIAQDRIEYAEAASEESAPIFADHWDRRFELARLFSGAEQGNDRGQAWKCLAREALAAGEDKVAADAASEGLGIATTDVELRELRVDAAIRVQDWEAAEDDLSLLADQHTEEGSHSQAESYLVRAIEIRPQDDALASRLAQCQIVQGHIDDAVVTLRHLADEYRIRGNVEAAIARSEQIVELEPHSVDAKDFLAAILIGAERIDRAMEIWREIGDALIAKGDAEGAQLRFEGILVHRGRDIKALRLAADLTRETKGSAEAFPRYKRLLDVLIEDAKPKVVEAEFKRLVKLDPDHLGLAEEYATYLHSKGQVKKAVKEMLRISRVHRDERDDPGEALRVIQLLHGLEPNNLMVLEEEAAIQENVGETGQAVSTLRKLAGSYRELGRETEAADAIGRCAELLPEDIEVQAEAAEAYEELKDEERATFFYLRAIGLYDQREDLPACIPLLKRVIALNPSRTDLGEALGQVYERTNQIEQAVDQWLEVGGQFETESNPDRAAEVYRHVKSIDAQSMEARKRLARLAEVAEDYEACLGELREMLPIAMGSHDDDEPISILRRILHLDPSDSGSRLALADEYRRLGREPELFDTLLDLEKHYAGAEEFAQALGILEELKGLRPDDLELVQRSFDLLVRRGELPEAAQIGVDLLDTYLERNDRDRAETMMQRIVELEPGNIERRIAIARLAHGREFTDIASHAFVSGCKDLIQNEMDEACLVFCEAGLELFPNSEELRQYLIQTLQRLGQNERAISEQLNLADLYESTQRDEGANEVYQRIVGENPDHVATHEAMVNLSLRQGDHDRTAEYLVRLAEIHYVAGKLEASISSIERLLEIVPERTELRSKLAELYHETGDTQKARDVWIATAEEFWSAESKERTIEIYERIRELYPDDIEILARLTDSYMEGGSEEAYLLHAMQLGRAYSESGVVGDAIDVLKRLSDREPKNVEVWEELAANYIKADEKSGAVRCFKCLHELHQSARRYDRAKTSLEEALELYAGDIEMLQQLGDVCLRLNQKADGIKHLLEATERLEEAERHDEARAIVDRVVKIDPTNLETQRLYGAICEKMGDVEGAVQRYSIASRGCAEKRQYSLAIDIFEHLLQLDPTRAEEREAYARALEREGRLDEACDQYLLLIEGLPADADPRQTIRYCRQILKETPDNPQAHTHLYEVYERTEKPRLALQECQWLMDHHLGREDSQSAEKYLRRGLEIAPDEVDLRKRLIEMLLASDRAEEAGDHLNQLATLADEQSNSETALWAMARACEVTPDNLEFRERLADAEERAGKHKDAGRTRIELLKLNLTRGEMEKARLMGEKVMESAPEDLDLRRSIAEIFEGSDLPEVAAFHYTMMAKSALAAKNYAQVRTLADSILRIKPHHLTAREYLLEALVALEESEEACDQSLEIYRLHLESEEFESAEKALKFVIERRPSTPEPRRLLVALYQRMNQPDSAVDNLRRLAELCVTAGDVQGAIDALKELLDERPQDTEARSRYIDLYSQIDDEVDLFDDYMQLAAAYRNQSSVTEATETFETLLASHPNRPECREQFIDFLFDQGQVTRGIEESRALAEIYLQIDAKTDASRVIDLALSRSPDNLELRHQLAELQIRTNRRGLALETLRELFKFYESDGDKEKMADTLERILQIDNLNIDLMQELADLYTGLGRNDQAVSQRKALAEQYLGRQLYDLAEREYRRILDLDPGDVDLWQQVIETHLRIGTPSDVIPDWLALAGLYVVGGRLKDAAGTYQRILDFEPDNIEVLSKYLEVSVQFAQEEDLVDDYLKMATLLSQSGDVRGALKIYRHLHKLMPGNAAVEELLHETGELAKKGQTKRKSGGGAADRLADFLEAPDTEDHSGTDQVEQGIRNYHNILKLNPENPVVRSKLAELLARAQKTEDADEQWATAAGDFFNRGDFTRCIEIYTGLLERHPGDQRIRERLSRAVLQRESLNAIENAIGGGDTNEAAA